MLLVASSKEESIDSSYVQFLTDLITSSSLHPMASDVTRRASDVTRRMSLDNKAFLE